MSAYSDYKAGAIGFDEFKRLMRWECEDRYSEYNTCSFCSNYKACKEQVRSEGCPQCEDRMDWFESDKEVYDLKKLENEFIEFLNSNTDYKWEIVSFNIYDMIYEIKTTDKTGCIRKFKVSAEILETKEKWEISARALLGQVKDMEDIQ